MRTCVHVHETVDKSIVSVHSLHILMKKQVLKPFLFYVERCVENAHLAGHSWNQIFLYIDGVVSDFSILLPLPLPWESMSAPRTIC